MKFRCLSCNHEWSSRGPAPSRQCPSCWKRAIANEDELRLAGIVALPLAKFSEAALLAPPTPEAVLKFPFAIASFIAVVNRAGNQVEKRRAIELMLMLSGIDSSEASTLAARLYP